METNLTQNNNLPGSVVTFPSDSTGTNTGTTLPNDSTNTENNEGNDNTSAESSGGGTTEDGRPRPDVGVGAF